MAEKNKRHFWICFQSPSGVLIRKIRGVMGYKKERIGSWEGQAPNIDLSLNAMQA